MSEGSGLIGSSGTFAGAMLESAGYYYQGLVLDSLAGPLITSVGAFIYLIGVIIAVVNILLAGKFKFSAWLLVGPGLYMMVVTSRAETFGSEWSFGGVSQSQGVVETEVGHLLEDRGLVGEGESLGPARVSRVFAWYNQLVSSGVNEVVRMLNWHRENVNWTFIVRQEMYARLHSTRIEDPSFRDLLNAAFLGKCREFVDVGRKLADERNTPRRQQLARQYQALAGDKHNISSALAIEWLAGFRAAYEREYDGLYSDIVELNYPQINSFLQKLEADPDSAEFVQIDVNFPSNILADLPIVRRDNSNGFRCDVIWQFVRVGLIIKARDVVLSSLNEYRDNEPMYREMLLSLTKITGTFDPAAPGGANPAEALELYQTIALYMFRNERASNTLSPFILDYVDRTQQYPIRLQGAEDMIEFEQIALDRMEFEKRTQLVTTAAQLPYYQGLVMHFLALTFPFFALLLLLPGYHSGFLYWFGLWFWIKCWDIGIAIVMIVDEVLFAMFSVAYQTGGREPQRQITEDLASTMYSLAETDPSFRLGTYYTIIGTALHMVPVATSILVLGSIRSGAGLIAKGIDTYATPFSANVQSLTGMSHVQSLAAQGASIRQKTATQYAKNRIQGRGAYQSGIPGKETISNDNSVDATTGSFSTLESVQSQRLKDVATGNLIKGSDVGKVLKQLAATEGVSKAAVNGSGLISNPASAIGRSSQMFQESLSRLDELFKHVDALEGATNAMDSREVINLMSGAGAWGMIQIAWFLGREYPDKFFELDLAHDVMLRSIAGKAGPTFNDLFLNDAEGYGYAKKLGPGLLLQHVFAFWAAYDLQEKDDSILIELVQSVGSVETMMKLQEELGGVADFYSEEYAEDFERALYDTKERFKDIEVSEEFLRAYAAMQAIGDWAKDNYLLKGFETR